VRSSTVEAIPTLLYGIEVSLSVVGIHYMSTDALECIEVFLVAYSCFNVKETGNSAVCQFFVIENTITKVRFNDESFMF
jgi:hypothetical protein